MNFKCAFFPVAIHKTQSHLTNIMPSFTWGLKYFCIYLWKKKKQNKTKVNLTAILLTFSVLDLIYNKVVQSSKMHNLRNKSTIVLIFIYSKCIFAKQDTDVNDSHSVHNV